MTREDVLNIIVAAQNTLTENSRVLAKLALRAGDDTRSDLSILRDSTASAVKELERARLALLVARTGQFERVKK